MCTINGFIQTHASVERQVGRYKAVQGAIEEGLNGRFKGEPRKSISAGIRRKELNRHPSEFMLIPISVIQVQTALL